MKFATCEETEPLLPVLLDGELPAPERAQVEAHLSSCTSCQEARDELRTVGNVLRRHFAWHAESEVTKGVIHELEGEVTEAILPGGKAESIEEIQKRIKALRAPNAPVPTERAEAVTNVTPAKPGVAAKLPGQASPESARPDGTRYLVGQVLGGYRIDGEVAKGGMGVVYRANQLSMDRLVALKVLSSRLAQDETFKKRFIREARAAATIDHPGIIKVYDAGEEKGETFFAMEYVPGDDAETVVLKSGPVEAHRSAQIGLEVARALEAAHRLGIIHRDVKPANVLLTQQGGVKLADLGLAKQDEGGSPGEAHLTVRRTVMGSPNYMPPEQARDARDTDARSDVYSLGATLFQLVTGSRPWGGGSSVEIMARVMDPAPLALPDLATNQKPIDPGIKAIIARAAAKDRAQRYQTMTALREDLEAYLKGEPLEALQPVQAGKKARRTSGNMPAVPSGRRRPTSDSSRRTVEAGPSGRRAAVAPRTSSTLALVAGGLVVLGVGALLLKRGSSPEVPPEVSTDESPRRPEGGDPAARPPTPAAVTSRAQPSPSSPAADAREADRAYEDVVRETDRLTKLDRWGEALALLERFALERPAAEPARRAQREAGELHARIATRLRETLADSDVRERRGDWEGAEDALVSVQTWGDEAAKARAQDAVVALRSRAAVAVPAPGPQEKPDATPVEAKPPSPSPAAPPAASPPATPVVSKLPLTPEEVAALAGTVRGKLESLPGGRVKLAYDFQSAAQADDWTLAPLEPAWVREAFEPLPSAPVPAPYDHQDAWSPAHGAFLGTGWRRRRTTAVFAAEPLRIDVQARLLSARNLVVTCGDPARPFVVGLGLHLSDAPFPRDSGRSKEEAATLAAIHRAWRELAKPSIAVARERGPFDWVLTAPLVPFQPSGRVTHLVVELTRDAEGDWIVVGCDAHRSKVALGKDAFAAGPVGLEVLGRPVVFEALSVVGTLDPTWARSVLKR